MPTIYDPTLGAELEFPDGMDQTAMAAATQNLYAQKQQQSRMAGLGFLGQIIAGAIQGPPKTYATPNSTAAMAMNPDTYVATLRAQQGAIDQQNQLNAVAQQNAADREQRGAIEQQRNRLQVQQALQQQKDASDRLKYQEKNLNLKERQLKLQEDTKKAIQERPELEKVLNPENGEQLGWRWNSPTGGATFLGMNEAGMPTRMPSAPTEQKPITHFGTDEFTGQPYVTTLNPVTGEMNTVPINTPTTDTAAPTAPQKTVDQIVKENKPGWFNIPAEGATNAARELRDIGKSQEETLAILKENGLLNDNKTGWGAGEQNYDAVVKSVFGEQETYSVPVNPVLQWQEGFSKFVDDKLKSGEIKTDFQGTPEEIASAQKQMHDALMSQYMEIVPPPAPLGSPDPAQQMPADPVPAVTPEIGAERTLQDGTRLIFNGQAWEEV